MGPTKHDNSQQPTPEEEDRQRPPTRAAHIDEQGDEGVHEAQARVVEHGHVVDEVPGVVQGDGSAQGGGQVAQNPLLIEEGTVVLALKVGHDLVSQHGGDFAMHLTNKARERTSRNR